MSKHKKTEIPTNDPATRVKNNSKGGQMPSVNTREQVLEQQYQNQNPNQGPDHKNK